MFIARNKQKKSNNLTNSSSSSSSSSLSNNNNESSPGGPKKKKYYKASSSSSSQPTTVSIQGINVHFPFTPYPNQKTYMETVMRALHSSENALLESPTGTGKTLCLLCSTLAWQLEQRSNSGPVMGVGGNNNAAIVGSGGCQKKVPTIIYASRTHSQLSQVVKEMRFTRYRPKHAVLGSREQMCIHPKVNPTKSSSSKSSSSKGSNTNNNNNTTSHDINTACTKLNKERKCRFRNNLEGFVLTNENTTSTSTSTILSENQIQQPVYDIEELVTMGQKRSICPFYFTRNQISNADIIFIPYNYLFDTEARKNTLNEVEFENSIIIFDEAHNLESFASDSASFDLTSVDIGGCIVEVSRCIGYMQSMPELMDSGKDNSSNGGGGKGGSRLSMDNLLKLKSIFLQLEQYLESKVPANGGSFSGEYIFEILKSGANITFNSHMVFLRFVRQVSECIMDMRSDLGGGSSAGGRNSTSSGTPKLDHFVSCIRRVFGSTEGVSMARARSYRVHISPKNNQGPSASRKSGGGFVTNNNNHYGNNQGRKLSYWCFAPALAMNELAALKVRSILVTSGTLSPLPSYRLELGIPFPHMLENNHIIKKEQIAVCVVGDGVSGKNLSSSFKRRDDSEYITELGNTIISLVRVIPGGVLVFFSSYDVMEKCIESWGGPTSAKSRAGNYANKSNFFQARKRSNNQAAGRGIGRYCFPHAILSGKSPSQWQRLLSLKSIIIEPHSSSELKDVIDEFEKYISMPKSTGCIMMGVCRGKISEGIDFADEKCRAVIITGIPFAPYLDPKVKLKREYLDGIRSSMTTKASVDGGFDSLRSNSSGSPNVTLSGAEWYDQQAHRAVNQAIGRVIRHRFDYGSILFLDSRYREAKNQLGTSKWIRPCFEKEKGIGSVISSLVRFYRAAQAIVDEGKKANLFATPKPTIRLRYEDEPNEAVIQDNALGDSVTKVSFIKKDLDQKDKENGYIPPNKVIKKVELKDHKGEYASHTDHDNKSKLLKNDIARKRVELQKKLAKSVVEDDKSKQNAKRFYQLAQNCLSSSDFKAMGKALLSMKKQGESKDSDAYICEAKRLLNILLLYDPCRVQNNTEKKSDSLVEHLLPLLPPNYRHSIEKIACEIRYSYSLFKEECSKVLEATECQLINAKVPFLMINHNRVHEGNVLNERMNRNSYMGDYYTVVRILMSNNQGSLLKYLYPLVPKNQIKMVRILVKDYQATQQVKAMKENDMKRYGESGIKDALFQKPGGRDIVLDKVSKNPKDGENREALHRAGKLFKERKEIQQGPWEASSKTTREQNKKRKATTMTSSATLKDSNKSSKSLFDKIADRPTKKSNTQRCGNEDPKKLGKTSSMTTQYGIDNYLERCLQVANTERFQTSKGPPEKNMNSVRSNAPTGTICTICDLRATDLYMSPCNHIVCSNCWAKWLNRSETCPSCRKPVKKTDLSKVVYHETTENLPSLTQMCKESSDEEEEEELEIIK